MPAVTQLHDVVYIARNYWKTPMLRFNATTHEQLTDVSFRDMSSKAIEIVACEQTSQVYVLDSDESIWRMSADGTNIELLLKQRSVLYWSDDITRMTLSLTSSRLLVTVFVDKFRGKRFGRTSPSVADYLIQFDAGGRELRRVNLPVEMSPRHAVESPAGTFIVSNRIKPLKENGQHRISEVDMVGNVLRHFTGSRLLKLGFSPHIAVDSRGNILVADYGNCHILLLDARLTPRGIVIDKHQLNNGKPQRLCYVERTGQLLVSRDRSVAVFDMLCR